MAINVDDVYLRLCALLLRAPRDPRHEESGVYRLCRQVLEAMGESIGENPVNGVGLLRDEKGDAFIEVFLRRKVRDFEKGIYGILDLGNFRILPNIAGDFVPTARPAQGGDSIGEGASGGESGTFGALVQDAARERFLLTCHHAVVEINSGVRGSSPVWQPSSGDGGKPNDRIGVLRDFGDIICDGHTPNRIDAAIVQPLDSSDVTDGIRMIGQIRGTCGSYRYGQPVEKVGWRTKRTAGTHQYRMSFLQQYRNGKQALFEDQLGIVGINGDFSTDGDSGSLVLTDRSEAYGLVFSKGSQINLTIANPIRDVWSRFGVTPV